MLNKLNPIDSSALLRGFLDIQIKKKQISLIFGHSASFETQGSRVKTP